jgi:hypothetical protein
LRLNTGITSEMIPKNGSATMYTSGCPKNQNRCCHSNGPPVAGSNTWAPRRRSASSASSAGGQQREDHQDEQGRDQDVPREDRHPEHRHAGRAQSQDRRDHVDRAEDRAQTGDHQTDDPQVGTDAGRVDRVVERRVGEPAEVGRATGGDEAEHRDRAAEGVQPVREGVEPRERDVGSADLQRHHEVGEGEDDRRGEEQQHDRAVHREQLVVDLGRKELRARLRQLGAHGAAP